MQSIAVGEQADLRPPLEHRHERALGRGAIAVVAGRVAEEAEFGNEGAGLGRVGLLPAQCTGPQVDVAMRDPDRRGVEARQQPVGEVPRLGEQHRIAARMISGQQTADEADRGFEHRHFAIDVEVEVGLHPIDAVAEFVVETHDPQGVERLDQRQAEVVVLEREALEAAADRLDLVLAPGVLAIVAPRPAHLGCGHLRRARASRSLCRMAPRRRAASASRRASSARRASGDWHRRRLATPTRRATAGHDWRRARSARIAVHDRPARSSSSRPSASTTSAACRKQVVDRVLAGKHTLGGDADRRRQVAVLSAAGACPRRHGAGDLAADRADARPDPKRRTRSAFVPHR